VSPAQASGDVAGVGGTSHGAAAVDPANSGAARTSVDPSTTHVPLDSPGAARGAASAATMGTEFRGGAGLPAIDSDQAATPRGEPAVMSGTASAAGASSTAGDDGAPSMGFLQTDPPVDGYAAAAGMSPAATAGQAADPASAADMNGAPLAGIAIAVAGSMSGAASMARAVATAAAAGADRHARSNADGPASPNTPAATPDASQLSGASSFDTSPGPAVKLTLGADTTEFGQGLQDHLASMLATNLTSAKLQVNPAELGPIEVRIAVQGDHAAVWLMSHSAVTRDALESSSVKLREMLGAQGFAQVSVDISQRNFQERAPGSAPYDDTRTANRNALPGTASAAAAGVARISTGALDAYA
jgi:flagellar hook-length control protein FliK